MNLILNIGLAPKPLFDLSERNVLQVLRRNGLTPTDWAPVVSSTEPALVVHATLYRGFELHACLNRCATALGQDCIAVFDDALGVGQLIGPRSTLWGEFNPEFFLMLDGVLLAESFVS